MANKNQKYNALEVHITRSVAGLFLFALLLGSVWGIRKLHLLTGWAIYASVALLLGVTLTLALCLKRQRNAGIVPEHRVWGIDYWLYIAATALAAHTILLVSQPVDWWVYTAPISFLLIAELYVVYITVWNLERNDRFFGLTCAVTGAGMLLNYQTYYNPRQNFVTFRFFSQDIAFTIGWVALAVLMVAMWVLGKKKGFGIWKQEGALAIFACYWFVLQMGWGRGLLITLIFGGVLLLYYVVLRILKQIRVIA